MSVAQQENESRINCGVPKHELTALPSSSRFPRRGLPSFRSLDSPLEKKAQRACRAVSLVKGLMQENPAARLSKPPLDADMAGLGNGRRFNYPVLPQATAECSPAMSPLGPRRVGSRVGRGRSGGHRIVRFKRAPVPFNERQCAGVSAPLGATNNNGTGRFRVAASLPCRREPGCPLLSPIPPIGRDTGVLTPKRTGGKVGSVFIVTHGARFQFQVAPLQINNALRVRSLSPPVISPVFPESVGTTSPIGRRHRARDPQTSARQPPRAAPYPQS